MKRLVLVIGLMIGAAILARSVPAQQPGRPGRGGPPGRGAALPIVAALDANGDGELSAQEIDNAAAALRTLDKNKDGKLTRDEMLPVSLERGPGGPDPGELVARMMAFDKNGDGKLSKDELPERIRGLLDRADVNKDGFVDKDELSRLAQQTGRGGRLGPGAGAGQGGFPPREGGRGPGEEREQEREDRPRS